MENRFCWVMDGRAAGPDAICDIDLALSAEAAVVPTIGSIVPGWLLIVPRVRSLSFAALEEPVRQSSFALARNAAESVSDLGSDVYFMEHGACASARPVGCGVDQAHLHVVPLGFDLITKVQEVGTVEWIEADPNYPWKGLREGRDYYLVGTQRRALLGYPTSPTSQHLRKVIAAASGCADQWDYRRSPF